MFRNLLPGMLMLVLASGFSRAGDAKDKDDAKSATGTWTMAKGIVGGKAFSVEERKAFKLVINGTRYEVEGLNMGQKFEDKGTLKYDASKKPRQLTIEPDSKKGEVIKAIYELDGDKLKVCYDFSGKDFPTKFEAGEGTPFMFAEYVRAKK
jgi:uncharacterized protein (TIGR03067 family)